MSATPGCLFCRGSGLMPARWTEPGWVFHLGSRERIPCYCVANAALVALESARSAVTDARGGGADVRSAEEHIRSAGALLARAGECRVAAEALPLFRQAKARAEMAYRIARGQLRKAGAA